MKKVMIMGAIALFAMAAGFSPHAGAQTLSMSAPAPPTMVFNTAGVQASGYLILSLTGLTSGTYYAFVDVTPVSAARNQWSRLGDATNTLTLPYNVYNSSNYLSTSIITAKSETPTRLLTSVFTANSTIQVPYYFSIASSTNSPSAGTYITTLTFGLYGSTKSNLNQAKTFTPVNVELSFTVNPQASITISTGDPGGNVVFGDVSAGAGASKDISILVRSNFRYSLRVSSANGGIMVNPDSDPGESIAYTLNINSATPLLSVPGAPYDIALNQRFTGNDTLSGGFTYPGTITLGTINAFTAGEYRDSLTFTVSAQ